MSDRHQRLFDAYVQELRQSKAFAERWWKGLCQESPEGAESRWPDGPASHPKVVAVIQKYYRGCEMIDRIGDEVVSPNVFLVDWLMEDETEDLVDFLAGLSYWPIGLNEKDEVI